MLNLPDGALYDLSAPFNQKNVKDLDALEKICECGEKMKLKYSFIMPYFKCPICEAEYEIKEKDLL